MAREERLWQLADGVGQNRVGLGMMMLAVSRGRMPSWSVRLDRLYSRDDIVECVLRFGGQPIRSVHNQMGAKKEKQSKDFVVDRAQGML